MPDEPSTRDGLPRAVRAVAWLVPELDDVAIAEVLWLAAALDGRPPPAGRSPTGSGDGPVADGSGSTAPSVPLPDSATDPPSIEGLTSPTAHRPRRATATTREVYENIVGTAPSSAISGHPVVVPRGGALPKPLELGRGLRPFKRAWAPGPRLTLDIEATARDYARSGELLPTLRPRRERFLDLALVVDRSPTMAVWQEVAEEFAGVLRRLGAFKRVRIWDLTMGEDGGPLLRAANGADSGPPIGRRHQIMVLSDCSAHGWYRPPVWRLLHQWGAAVPTTLVNPLPSRLWRLTALDLPAVRVSSPGAPAVRNTRLDYRRPWHLRFGEDAEVPLTPLPVAMLTPYGLESWARVLMSAGAADGADSAGCDAVLVPEQGRFETEPLDGEEPLSGAELVAGFLTNASAPAARLAVMCAPYTSLTMPLLHLVQQTVVPEATVAEVAEVVVSGLFTTSAGVPGDVPGTVSVAVPRAGRSAPVLRPRLGVQEALEDLLGAEDAWRMYEGLTRYIAAHAGSLASLAAAIRDPAGPIALPAELRPFAAATADTLRVLGALPPTEVEAVSGAAEAGEPAIGPGDDGEEVEFGRITVFSASSQRIGTSTTVVTAAWILASHGKRVLVVEWIPEPPSVAFYLQPFLDLRRADSESRMTRTITIPWDFPDGGALIYAPEGLVARENLSADHSRDALDLQALRDELRTDYDHVLVLITDWNLTPGAAASRTRLPDDFVACFPVDDPGAAAAQVLALAQRMEPSTRVFPVPMGVATDPDPILRQAFPHLPKGIPPTDADRYWETAGIPYRSSNTVDDIPAVFLDAPGEPGSVLAAVENLVGWITGGMITQLPPMNAATRRRILDLYTRNDPSRYPYAVVVAYVGPDRLWAEWVAAVIGRVARSTTLHRVDGSLASLSSEQHAQHYVLVVSSDFQRLVQNVDLPIPATANDIPEITTVGVSPGLSSVVMQLPLAIDLTGFDEHDAQAALLAAMGRSENTAAGQRITDLRYPGIEPLVLRAPARNPSFTGRDDVLEELRDRLTDSSLMVILPVALYGLGGVGKTQMAIEFAYRFRSRYDVVWWIDADDQHRVAESLAELASHVNVQDVVGDNVRETADAVREALQRGEPHNNWLLVFDNAAEPEEVMRFVPAPPPSGTGHVLITSRHQGWSQVARSLEVGVFSRSEGVQALVRGVPGLSEEDAGQVAEWVGDLPLAVDMAKAWLAETGMPVAEYLGLLAAETMRKIDQLSDYPTSVVTAWTISTNRLRENMPAAARLLQIMAFMDGDGIAMELLQSDEMVQALGSYGEHLNDRRMIGTLISAIVAMALARVDPSADMVQVHRLIQSVVRDHMDENEQARTRHQVHRLLAAARPQTGDVDDPESQLRYQLIWPHLEPSRAIDCDGQPVWPLLIDRVRFLWQSGSYQQALEAGRALERRWTERLNEAEASPALARQFHYLRSQIANVLRSLGEFGDAYELDNAVREAQTRILPRQDPHLLESAAGSAGDLRGLGRWQQALELDLATYEDYREVFWEDHPAVLAAANRLAISCRLLGDFTRARDISVDTLARSRSVLGDEHPRTLFTAVQLAGSLRDAGQYADSLELLSNTVSHYRDVRGEAAPATLQAMTSLAVSLRKCGFVNDALDESRAVHHHYLADYPADSPDALAGAANLASALNASGDAAAAASVLENVHTVYRTEYGPEHPHTLVCFNNMGLYLFRSGARDPRLLRTAYEGLMQVLGGHHPFSMAAALNLASVLVDAGETEEALSLDGFATGGFHSVLGPEHPDTLAAAGNRVITLRAVGGRSSTLDQEHSRIVASLSGVLGDNHALVARLREWRRADFDLEILPI